MNVTIQSSSSAKSSDHRAVLGREILVSWRTEIGVGVALLLMIAAFSALAPNFFTFENFSSLLQQTSVVAIIAIGMTMVIIAGEIDLSVGAMVGLSGVVFAWLVAKQGVPMSVAFAAVLLIAALVGGFIGGLRIGWGIPSFIVTLGLLSALRGIAFLISDGLTIGPLPASLEWLWYGKLLGVSTPIVLTVVAAFLGWLMLSQSRFGRHLYALGGNSATAARYGVSVRGLRVVVFIIVQMLAALVGVMLAARLNSGSGSVGELIELDVIAAVVVGGTSLNGGVGRIIGTLLGVLFVAVLRNGMVLRGVDPIVFMVAQGFVIILAVWWSMLRPARSQSRSGK